MGFNTLPFVFVFLPLFLAAFYLVPARWRAGLLCLGSLVFYVIGVWQRPWCLAPLLGLAVLVYLLGLAVFVSYLLALYLNVRFQLYKKTIFPLLLVLSGGCNHLLVLAARWIFLKDEYGMSSRYEIQYQMGIVGILLTFALVWSMCREKAQETEADKAKTRVPEKRAARTLLKVCMLAFTVLTVFGNAWTTRAEIRTAPYRKAYLQVSRELGRNYRTASDEDLETYLHNDPDAVRDAMRILEENHLNIFR